MRYMIDTCIWLDFLQDREHSSEAASFIASALRTGNEVVVPELVAQELKGHAGVLDVLHITRIDASREQVLLASRLSLSRGLPFNDCLIVCQAKDCQAIVITRDKHFLRLLDICACCKPEDVNLT